MKTCQCCALEDRNKRSASLGDVFSTRYDIALSNNGHNFGTTETLHVFDSTCQDALPDADYGHKIVLKSGFCFIDGVCVGENEISMQDKCFSCKTHTSVFKWTKSCTPTDEDNYNIGVILGSTLGSVTSVILVVGIYSIWHFKIKPKYKNNKSVSDSQLFTSTAVGNTR